MKNRRTLIINGNDWLKYSKLKSKLYKTAWVGEGKICLYKNFALSREIYLDYFNNYLSIDYFAKCYGITKSTASRIIKYYRSRGI